MKTAELISTVRGWLGEDAGLKVHLPTQSMVKFLRRATSMLSPYFPLVYDATVPVGGNYFDLPTDPLVGSVLSVQPFRASADVPFPELHPFIAMYGTDSYLTTFSSAQDYIALRLNLRAVQVLVGKEFSWMQGGADHRNRVYVDDVPTESVALFVRYSSPLPQPPEPEAEALAFDFDYPEPQSDFLYRILLAMSKQTEGRILRKLSGGSQGATTDGTDLVTEGTQELDALTVEIRERGYSLLSL